MRLLPRWPRLFISGYAPLTSPKYEACMRLAAKQAAARDALPVNSVKRLIEDQEVGFVKPWTWDDWFGPIG